jgi:hypothetical protein
MPEVESEKPLRVSHSMAEAYAACQKRYEYAHLEQLAPKEVPAALALGTYGHKVFEIFFNDIKDGISDKDAMLKAMRYAYSDIQKFDKVGESLLYWFESVWPTLGWKILEVEKTTYLELNTETQFPFTIDLLIELNGQLYIVDHKFTADQYPEEVLLIYPQMPKYVGALRATGTPVVGGIYNIVRTRAMKDISAKLVRQPMKINRDRIINSMKMQLAYTERIRSHEGEYLRNINNNCKYCPFVDLCGLEMNGEDSTSLKAVNFVPNTYGYNGEK